MGNRLTKIGGNDFTEEGLRPVTDLVPTLNLLVNKYYADNVGGSASITNAVETDLATFTISQDDLGSNGNLKIDAGIFMKFGNGTVIGTFNLYVDGVSVKTFSGDINSTFKGSWGSALAYVATGLDTSGGSVIVKVTGLGNNASSANYSVTGLTGIGSYSD